MKKKILLIILGLFIFVNVNAENVYLTLDYQEGIYYTREGGNLPYKSSQFALYKMKGSNLVYCIDPGTEITEKQYVDTNGYIESPYSEEITKKLELIGNYGYEYPGHSDIKYAMATQSLIWELTSNQTIKFWTEKDGKGNQIDISKEKEEIMNLVNKHNKLPSFNGHSFKGNLNQDFGIVDAYNVLDTFETNDPDTKIIDNYLQIIPTTTGEREITFTKKHYDDKKTIIFIGRDQKTQVMAKLRFSDDITFSIKLNVSPGNFIVQKVDAETNEKLEISGIRFKVKNLDTNEYLCENNKCEFITNNEGNFKVSNIIYGTYQIEECSNQKINGYSVNKEKMIIKVDENTKFNKIIDELYYLPLNFSNAKEVYEIPKTSYNSPIILISSIFSLLGITIINYEKRFI